MPKIDKPKDYIVKIIRLNLIRNSDMCFFIFLNKHWLEPKIKPTNIIKI